MRNRLPLRTWLLVVRDVTAGGALSECPARIAAVLPEPVRLQHEVFLHRAVRTGEAAGWPSG